MGATFEPRERRTVATRVRLTKSERGELERLGRVLKIDKSDVIRLGLELVRAKVARREARAAKGGTS